MPTSGVCIVRRCNALVYARKMCCSHYKRHLKSRPSGAARPRRGAASDGPPAGALTPLPEFLAALAAALPSLPGARCRGRGELFDATISGVRGAPHEDLEYARNAALRLCHQCPALLACTRWLESLPTDQRPLGVIAGRIPN